MAAITDAQASGIDIGHRMKDLARKLGWFALIWVLSVAALGVLAYLIRWLIR